jgi:hypothetical protein
MVTISVSAALPLTNRQPAAWVPPFWLARSVMVRPALRHCCQQRIPQNYPTLSVSMRVRTARSWRRSGLTGRNAAHLAQHFERARLWDPPEVRVRLEPQLARVPEPLADTPGFREFAWRSTLAVRMNAVLLLGTLSD